jgi:hypothetical protein
MHLVITLGSQGMTREDYRPGAKVYRFSISPSGGRGRMTVNTRLASETFCDGCGEAKSSGELKMMCDGTLQVCAECFERARMIVYTRTSDYRLPVLADVPLHTAIIGQSKVGMLESLAQSLLDALSHRNRRS